MAQYAEELREIWQLYPEPNDQEKAIGWRDMRE